MCQRCQRLREHTFCANTVSPRKRKLESFFYKKCRKISWHCPFNRSSFLSSSDYKDDDLENDGINDDNDYIDDDCTDI